MLRLHLKKGTYVFAPTKGKGKDVFRLEVEKEALYAIADACQPGAASLDGSYLLTAGDGGEFQFIPPESEPSPWSSRATLDVKQKWLVPCQG